MNHAAKLAASSLILALTLAACGGGGGSDDAPAPTAPGSSSSSSKSSSSASTSSQASSSTSSASSTTSSSSSTAAALFATTDLDADGWFWFSNANAVSYLVGESSSCLAGAACTLDGTATVNSGEFIFGMANTIAAGTTSASWNSALAPTAAGVTYTKTGGLIVPKASSAGGIDGGSVVFKLASLSSFQAFTSTTGSMYYAVDTSTNGSSWVEKYTSGATAVRSKGESTEDIGAKTGTSSSAIYVRIRNLGTGGLNIMGVKIVQ